MSGSTTEGSFGVSGTEGIAAPQNIPGCRSQAVTWTDQKGNLWLFGGSGFDTVGNAGYLNDLWEFSPSTNEWALIAGSSTLPGEGYEAVGSYGTLGVPAASNLPPGRVGGAGWTDGSGNLWMFGGFDYDTNPGIAELQIFGDLWEFNPSTKEWTWMGGSQIPNQAGVYGTEGTAAATNVPGSRYLSVALTDAKGNFWLFGGLGFDGTGADGNLNDLWKFDPSTNQWTWVSGSETGGQLSVPGTLKQAAAGNVPAGRSGAVGWMDAGGNLWIFGGEGTDSPADPVSEPLNDLWEFNPTSGEWAWMGGLTLSPTIVQSQPGVYGTLRTPSATNIPGSRLFSVGWTDAKGNLWMFGGLGYDANNLEGELNDFWEFNPSTDEWTWVGGATTAPTSCGGVDNWCGQPGVYGTLHSPSLADAPGGRYSAARWSDSKGNFWMFGGTGTDSQAGGGYLSDLWEYQPNGAAASIAATPTFSPEPATFNYWPMVTISDTTPGSTIYYTINGGSPAVEYTGPIRVTSTETIEAIASASGYANSDIATGNFVEQLSVTPAPVFSVQPGTYATAQTVTITNGTAGAVIYYAVGSTPTMASTVYTGPITVSSPETLEAIAVANNSSASTVSIAQYNIQANPTATWTWMGGSTTVPSSCYPADFCGPPGWYGTLQTEAAANVPRGREGASTWTDNKGNLWMFGGERPLIPLNDLWKYDPSTSEWAWMAGSNPNLTSTLVGSPGVYGTQGTAAPGNTPGSRSFAASWKDGQGNFWVFGGDGVDANQMSGVLNDMWMFNPSTNEWTWTGGQSALTCQSANNCLIPAGSPGTLGTLAPGNFPSGRTQATSWTDHNGDFWMYGGVGADFTGIECSLNDLWKFDPSSKNWAWMGGTPFCPDYDGGYLPQYGTVGVPAVGNNPGSLSTALGWSDSSGRLWLFGGFAEDPSVLGYYENDTWMFDPSISQWALMSPNSFDSSGNSDGVYSSVDFWQQTNNPGVRENASNWTDGQGNFWMFGGYGFPSTYPLGTLNDLWEFKPSINEWAWMGGSSTLLCLPARGGGSCAGNNAQPGTYGALGSSTAGSIPGSRLSAATWTDSKGNLWMFGGAGFGADGYEGLLNDLWEYDLKGSLSGAAPIPAAATPTFSPAAGAYTSAQTLTITDQTPGTTIYYTTDGTNPTSTSAVYTTPLTIPVTETIEAVAIAANYAASTLAIGTYNITLPAAAAPVFSVPAGTYDSTQTVTISDTTPGATIYYTTDGTTPTTTSAKYSTGITVSASETLKAIAVASGYSNSAVATAAYIFTLPPTFTLETSLSALTISPGAPGTTTLIVTPEFGFNSAVTFACSGLPAGATCSFSQQSVTPSSGIPATSNLTISTSGQSALRRPSRLPDPGEIMLAVMIAIIVSRRRRFKQILLFAIACIALQMIAGCGGNKGGGGSSPVTATVTISATAGALQETTSISLTVQ